MMEAPESFGSRQEIERWLRQWSLYAKLPPRGMAIVLREHFQKARDGRWRWRFGGRLRELQRTQPREVLFPTQWHVLSRIRCPVLIVRGGRSESLLPEVAERTRAALRDALLVEIPDCSHFPFLERPRELTLVNLVGNIDLDKLASLEGEFGIPHISKSREKEREKGRHE